MKTINYSFIIIISLAFMGCLKDASYNIPTDICYYVSKYPDGNAAPVGSYMMFRDMSKNAVSHEWIINDVDELGNVIGEGCKRLKFYSCSIDTTSVLSGNVVKTTDAYVLFKNSGYARITLINKFKTKVQTNTANPIEAVYEDSTKLWRIEKSWTIECFGKLKPAVKIYLCNDKGENQGDPIMEILGDENTDVADLKEVNIKQGQYLNFVYDTNSEYKADSWSYFVPGGKNTEDIGRYVYCFNTATTKDMPFTGFVVNATRNAWYSVPSENVSKKIPMKLNVEMTNLMASNNDISQMSNKNDIIIPFNKNIKQSNFPIDIAQDFKLNIKSESNSNNQLVPVSAKVQNNNIILHFDNLSTIDTYCKKATLSYKANPNRYFFGNDDVDNKLYTNNFENLPVNLYLTLKPKYFSFDVIDPKPACLFDGWWMSNTIGRELKDDGSFIFSKEIVDGNENCLGYDIKGKLTGDLTAMFSNIYEKDVEIKPGKYIFKFKIFVESIKGDGDLELASNVKYGSKYVNERILLYNIKESTAKIGKWETIENIVDIPEGKIFVPTEFRIRAKINGFNGPTVFYIDDLYMEKIN